MLEGIPVGLVERILYLKKLPALAGLPTADLAAIAELQVDRSFRAGEVFLRSGEEARGVYFVLEGAIDCHRRGRFVGRVGPGGGLGRPRALRAGPRRRAGRGRRPTAACSSSTARPCSTSSRTAFASSTTSCAAPVASSWTSSSASKVAPFLSLAPVAPAQGRDQGPRPRGADLLPEEHGPLQAEQHQRPGRAVALPRPRSRFPAGTVLWKAGGDRSPPPTSSWTGCGGPGGGERGAPSAPARGRPWAPPR